MNEKLKSLFGDKESFNIRYHNRDQYNQIGSILENLGYKIEFPETYTTSDMDYFVINHSISTVYFDYLSNNTTSCYTLKDLHACLCVKPFFNNKKAFVSVPDSKIIDTFVYRLNALGFLVTVDSLKDKCKSIITLLDDFTFQYSSVSTLEHESEILDITDLGRALTRQNENFICISLKDYITAKNQAEILNFITSNGIVFKKELDFDWAISHPDQVIVVTKLPTIVIDNKAMTQQEAIDFVNDHLRHNVFSTE